MKIILLFSLFSFCTFVNAQDADKEFRNFWMPLAAAAYSENPIVCINNVQSHWGGNESDIAYTVFRQYTFFCDAVNDTCMGYVALQQQTNNSGNIIIGFSGITNYEQFYGDSSNFDEMVPFVAGGKVSKALLDGFNGIWLNAGMKYDVYTLKNRFPHYDYYIVGHSLGGAMASLAAATIVATGVTTSHKLAVFTFGQPRIGDKDFANAFNAMLLLSSIRIIHNRDIVPHIPSMNGTNYYHNVAEFWYPNDMGSNDTYVSCSMKNGEDPNCSDSLDAGALTFDDHRFYFNREFIHYGINGCSDLASAEKMLMLMLMFKLKLKEYEKRQHF